MRIAHILSSFGMGGQERVALDLASGQRAAGHRVMAVSLAGGAEGPLARDFREQGVEVVTVPKSSGFDPALAVRLASLFRREQVEVVHTHNPQPLLYGAMGGRLAGAVVVHTKHGANPDQGRRLTLRRLGGRLAHAYVAVSQATADVARAKRECSEEKLVVIDNGIDLSRFHADLDARASVRAELGIPAEACVVISVGRVAPEKAHADLVMAMAPLLSDAVELVIAGDGSSMERVRDAVARNNVGKHVHLPGSRRDVPRLLASADVFAMSSITEGLPLVLPEAMASGLPIVSTAVGGIPTVVDEGVTGFLVPAGDSVAMRDRISTLVLDPALRTRMGERARAIALQRYSAERMVSDYLALYESLLPMSHRRSLPAASRPVHAG